MTNDSNDNESTGFDLFGTFAIHSDFDHAEDVIPAQAGIQENTGFPRIKNRAGLVKPGMTSYTRLMSS